MTKAILFDLDGIVMIGREIYFSRRYSKEHGIPQEVVNEFFLENFKKCTFGTCDLKEEIAPFLPRWNWHKSVEEFIEYWFKTESTTDEEVLKIIDALRAKGYPCYIATRQEKYRMKYLLEEVGLAQHFDGVFCTCDIGYDKSQPEFWQFVLKKLDLAPEEILFFDDKQKNVDTARTLGIDAHFYNAIGVLQEKAGSLY